MASSAPLPPELATRAPASSQEIEGLDPQSHVFSTQQVIVIQERGVHIPSFYHRHATPSSTVVKQDGLPLLSLGKPFMVSDVAPERRWAISEDGEVMQQHVFEVGIEKVRREWFASAYDTPQKYKGDIGKWHIPNVRNYVSMGVDPTKPSRLQMIHYNPHPGDTPKADATLYDPKEDRVISGDERLGILRAAYADPTLRKTLKPHEIEIVEAANGGTFEPVQGENDLLSRLGALNEKLAKGEITMQEHAAQVSALTGHIPTAAAPVEPAPERPKAKRKKPAMKMACGAEVYGFQKARHIASCSKCSGNQ